MENTKNAVHKAAQQGFEKEAQAYARGRPDYPAALSAWLAQALGLGPGREVADVGAGTGKFTALLATTGATVVGVEPVDAMRAKIDACNCPRCAPWRARRRLSRCRQAPWRRCEPRSKRVN